MTDARIEDTSHGVPVLTLHQTLDLFESGPESTHTEHCLTYLQRGSLRMEHGGEISVPACSVTVVPAGVPHTPIGGENVEYWFAGFCATCLGLDETQHLMSPFRRVRAGATPVIPIPGSRRRRVVRLFQDLECESRRDVPEGAELTRCLLLLLLGEVRRAMPGDQSVGTEGSLVSEALEFVQQRCLDPISLRDVAASVHRTPAHVATTVKGATGYSVGEWISAGRVAEAASRLAHTDDPIDQVASRVGWRDTTHFIRQFRKAYGSTPAAWRREHRSQHRG